MFEAELFLGFVVDPIFAKHLDQVNPALIAQFIKEGGDHLQQINHQGLKFIGKTIGKLTTLSELELIEKNIYSVLKKLVPDFSYDETTLYLISLHQ